MLLKKKKKKLIELLGLALEVLGFLVSFCKYLYLSCLEVL